MPNGEVVRPAGEIIRTEFYTETLVVTGNCPSCHWGGMQSNPNVVTGYCLTIQIGEGTSREDHPGSPKGIELILKTARTELQEELKGLHWEQVPDCFGMLTFT